MAKHGGQEHEPDQCGVDEKRDGDTEAHLLELHLVTAREADEHHDDDERSSRDDPRGRGHGMRHGVARGLPSCVAFADTTHEEHGVVHGEAEEHGEEEEGKPRSDHLHLGEAEQAVADAFHEHEQQ